MPWTLIREVGVVVPIRHSFMGQIDLFEVIGICQEYLKPNNCLCTNSFIKNSNLKLQLPIKNDLY